MYERYQTKALETRLRIPLLYGVDAVHGHNNVIGAVVFPHTVRAASSDRFVWDEPTDVSFVRGDLSLVDVYATNGSGDLAAADSLTDAELPVAGAGFYYMLRLGGECTVGSWQTRHGGQPGRDTSLP